MKIFELVKNYENCATDDLKNKYLKDNIKITDYIPFIGKITIAKKIINDSTYDKNKNIHIDSTIRYLSLCQALIQLYTDLERDTTTVTETDGETKTYPTEWHFEYDALKKSGVLDKLISNGKQSLIPYSEIVEFNTLLTMVYDDTIKNKYELHSYIDEKINIIKDTIKEASEPVVNTIIDKISELDDETFSMIVESIMSRLGVDVDSMQDNQNEQ